MSDTNDLKPSELKPGDKFLLTLSEAHWYFGLCEKRLRQLARQYKGQGLFVRNGTKLLVVRTEFEIFIKKMDDIPYDKE